MRTTGEPLCGQLITWVGASFAAREAETKAATRTTVMILDIVFL
jgi:hypothetical protein